MLCVPNRMLLLTSVNFYCFSIRKFSKYYQLLLTIASLNIDNLS